MQSMFDERVWLAWLVKVRIIILTFLLGIELAIARLTPTTLPLRFFINAILLWYAFSIFYLLLHSFWTETRSQSLLQVLTDLALVTLVVYATGGVDSSLNFLYPLVIIVACILLPRAWAYLTAALAFILYGAILDLTFFEIIPSYSTSHPGLSTLQAIIIVNLLAYLAVAYLATLLASKLRQVDVKLKHTSGVLENLQALHENIIESMTGGLITTRLDGHITLANPAAVNLLGTTAEALHGQSMQQIFADPLPDLDGERNHGEVRATLPNGYRKTFRVIVSPLTIPGGGVAGYVYTLDDLTEMRRLEREVRMQDRLAAVGRLASAIAHEIRNPLTSIAGSVSMLSGVPDLGDEHRKLLDIVTRESQRLNAIITDFLAYSRSKRYQMAQVDLLPLLEDTLTLLEHRLTAENIGIQLVRRYHTKQAMVSADGDKIKQVFWNFCENAVRAMPQGGQLVVTVLSMEEEWQVSFADTGPGIAPQLVEKIFEPFQSHFEGGTGLGLAIVYQIVQAHDGKVWARSKVGQGSEFVLRLRRAGGAEAVAPGTAEQSMAATAGKGGTSYGQYSRV
ncbi:MAG: PAS domain S-box protein [Acidobacteria bacterium]|jgi:two-component system sensor histidine kinase PilS (NtrC family)|nr:PAS domain S-box protein [Acidobacteriota bacterium]